MCDHPVTISAEPVERIVTDAVRAALVDVEGRASAESNVREAEHDAEQARVNYEAALAVLADFTDRAPVDRLRELREAWEAAQKRLEQLGGGAVVTINAGERARTPYHAVRGHGATGWQH
jgi:hypothetical protein